MALFLSVCLLTYRRNHLLRKLMHELCLEDMHDWEVVVVDTSGVAASREVLDEYVARPGHHVKAVYAQERLSISGGRNRALDEAEGEWILFMDDDQILQANVVGSVIAKIRDKRGQIAAARLGLQTKFSRERSGAVFENKLRKSAYYGAARAGKEVMKAYHLSTDGVVFKKPPESMRFAEELGYIGGEDNDFFARYLGDRDCEIWNDITITDLVMNDRIKVGYILRDSYRKGCSYAQLETERLDRSRGKLVPKYLRDFIGSVALLIIDVLLWRDWPNRIGLLARQCGKISGLFGRRYELYRDDHTNVS